MSCGSKLDGRYGGYWERQELADALDREGESRLADRVRHQECFDTTDLRRAERALDDAGMSKYFDYRVERCYCSTEDDGY